MSDDRIEELDVMKSKRVGYTKMITAFIAYTRPHGAGCRDSPRFQWTQHRRHRPSVQADAAAHLSDRGECEEVGLVSVLHLMQTQDLSGRG